VKIFGKRISLLQYVPYAVGGLLVIAVILIQFFPGFAVNGLNLSENSLGMAKIVCLGFLSLVLNRLRIHKLILRTFIGPFLVSFTVILFVLVLQFFSKYMEDLVGKDIGGDILAQVFGLACVVSVTMALPLGILLSSLLTIGNMGERYELASLKSAGVGLFKVIRPLIHATIVTTLVSFYFSFFVMPGANLTLYTLMYDLAKVKPTFQLRANHFYNGIDGMVLHVGDINRETDLLTHIKIFDHSEQVGNNRITLAEFGKMVPSEQLGFLDVHLFHGVIHETKLPEAGGPKTNEYSRFYFDTLVYKVPLQGFKLDKSDEETFSNHHYMLDVYELNAAADSLKKKTMRFLPDFQDYNRRYIHLDTILNKSIAASIAADTMTYPPSGPIVANIDKPVWEWFPDLPPKELITKTVNQVQALANVARTNEERARNDAAKWRKFRIEQHTRWMLPLSCIVFLFLGAPLGAIIRKGGIGIPVLFSIAFFILFYILMLQGKKFARDELLPIWVGVWLPILVMLPMALMLTWQSASDSPFLFSSTWYKIGRTLFGWMRKNKKKTGTSTMSIEEIVAQREKYKADARKRLEDHEKSKLENGNT
jgi:lipopolysaccharide export system permease protein